MPSRLRPIPFLSRRALPRTFSTPNLQIICREMSDNVLSALFENEPAPPPGAAAIRFSATEFHPEVVVGHRAATDVRPVAEGDLWHFGSVAKPMTSTLCGILVADGALGWDDPLADQLPELEGTGYAGVTLRILLGHRAGLPTDPPRLSLLRYLVLGGDPASASRRMLGQSIRTRPAFPVGSDFLYSNVGYGLAGLSAARALGTDFAALMNDRLLIPMGLRSVGFGLPPQDGTAPREHVRRLSGTGWKVLKHGPRVVDDLHLLQPSGCLHGPVAALAAFGQRHLQFAQGEFDGNEAPLAETHRPSGPAPEEGQGWTYGMGWFVDDVLQDGNRVLWHAGSTGGCFALLALIPDKASGVAMAANAFDPRWARPESSLLKAALRFAMHSHR